eukprot:233805-Rhodomonas_salina.2
MELSAPFRAQTPHPLTRTAARSRRTAPVGTLKGRGGSSLKGRCGSSLAEHVGRHQVAANRRNRGGRLLVAPSPRSVPDTA